MFSTVNVTVGAVLSVLLVSPMLPDFKELRGFGDLSQPLVFVILIILITANIHAATDALAEARAWAKGSRERRGFVISFICSVVIFGIMQVCVLAAYTFNSLRIKNILKEG